MKRWVKVCLGVLAGLLLAAGSGAAYLYRELEPKRHFAGTRHPVLAPLPETGQGVEQTPRAGQKQQAAFNVLLLGIDGQDGEMARTDMIMAAHVDPTAKKVNLISVPRDTRIEIPGIGYTKINHAHFLGSLQAGSDGGTHAALTAVSGFLQAEMNYYIKTDFQGFRALVDRIGGVDVDLPHPVGEFATGAHHLDGAAALKVVRERYSLPDGETGRQADQALVLRAMLEKMLKPDALRRLPELITQVKTDVIETNFSDADLLSLAWLFQGLDRSQLEYVQIPGETGTAYDPLVQAELSYWLPDAAEVKRISEIYLHSE
ncbi:LytR family transcriptional attenuator [Tumebacillus sp. BK434]|uniref:LCP family protein n=1 Tax=Tumebacillus sp. BK434 TaxID=2512169 RepID=UPI0010E39214|nr:LCP family protein [Tumebacillus sp. BK434]TCP58979.1 LytR family transcriptional attenuator [Tumebacillus sp. BK434]